MLDRSGARPVVVGIDGSPEADHAALWAAEEAARDGLGLRLVHAVMLSAAVFAGGYVPPAGYFTELEQQARRRLESVRDAVREHRPTVVVDAVLRSENPVRALVEESQRAALVVLGVHAPGGHRFFAGSTATAVAARAHCPVAVVPGAAAVAGEGPVVVGVDGSPVGDAALELALEEASRRHAELVAVHAWTEFTSDTEYVYALQVIEDWRPYQEEQTRMLAERLAGWQEKYPDVTIRRVVSAEKPATALLEQAEGAQLLVVGSHGRGGLGGLLLGSVSRALVHRAGCPLMVVHPREAGER